MYVFVYCICEVDPNYQYKRTCIHIIHFLQFFNFEGLFKEDCFITSFFLDLNSVYFLSYLFVFPLLNLHLYFQQFTNIHTVTKYTCSSPVTHFSPFPNSSLTPALLATTTPLVAAVAGSIPMGNENIPPTSHRDGSDSYSQTIP
jgi:hypothetical protein